MEQKRERKVQYLKRVTVSGKEILNQDKKEEILKDEKAKI
jgi:hypothetical protein